LARILEIVNLNIRWSEENIELDLLDTGFVSLVKTLGEAQGKRLGSIAAGDVLGIDLIQNISDRQAYIDLKLGEYQDEILAFLATPAGLELISQPTKGDMNLPFDSDYTLLKSFDTNTLVDYTLLEKIVKNEISLRKRRIDIERRLKILALLQLIKDFSSQARVTKIHPGMRIACFITGGEDSVSYSQMGSYTHSISQMIATFKALDDNYLPTTTIGSLILKNAYSYTDKSSLKNDAVVPELEFTTLGDAVIVDNKLYDFKDYSLSLVLKDKYNITLETIMSRV